MQDLKKILDTLVDVFCQFPIMARSILIEEGFTPAALKRIRQVEGRFIQEAEDLLKAFRQKVSVKEEELNTILHPKPKNGSERAREAIRQVHQIIAHLSLKDNVSQVSLKDQPPVPPMDVYWVARREHLAEQALKAIRQVYHLVVHLFAMDELAQVRWRLLLKNDLVRSWENKPNSDLLAEYQEALNQGDTDRIEIFETEAERFLRRKGDPQAASNFLSLKAQSLEARLTPTQKEVKKALEELLKIKKQATVAMCFLASTSRAYARLLPLCTNWRKDVRHRLDSAERRGISVTIRRSGGPSFPATLVEWSAGGLQVQGTEMFPLGTMLILALDLPGLTEQALALKGEVKWFREEQNQPGRYILGLRIVDESDVLWQDLFPGISYGLKILSSALPPN